jgi:hypothetical protein
MLNEVLQEVIHFVKPVVVTVHMFGVERHITASHSGCVLASLIAGMIL